MNVQEFTDLVAWQKSVDLTEAIYRLSLSFPTTEQYGLTSQIRRSATSVCANISEGFGRVGVNDKCRFYYYAVASNLETQNHIHVAVRLGYMSAQDSQNLLSLCKESLRLTRGLIRSTKRHL